MSHTAENDARIRRACDKRGHKFREIEGVPLPYVFCARWRCDVSAVSRFVDPRIAVALHNAIPLANRFPPVELAEDGSVLPPARGTDA